jgi:hypothetical protein
MNHLNDFPRGIPVLSLNPSNSCMYFVCRRKQKKKETNHAKEPHLRFTALPAPSQDKGGGGGGFF